LSGKNWFNFQGSACRLNASTKPNLARVDNTTPTLIGIDINRTVHDASDLMAEKFIRHLPGTENGTILGILSVRD
jgi:CBS domain-containing protein